MGKKTGGNGGGGNGKKKTVVMRTGHEDYDVGEGDIV